MSLSGIVQLGISTVIFLLAATVAKSWALAPSIGKLLLTLVLYSAGNLIMLRLVREFGMSSAFSLSAYSPRWMSAGGAGLAASRSRSLAVSPSLTATTAVSPRVVSSRTTPYSRSALSRETSRRWTSSRTASGSRAVAGQRARVARGSRIWVEGKHDAELVEKVWGDDLRVEGVVVELLDGVDNLADALADFGPTPQHRVGVLVDHLVPGSKEQRIADAALRAVPAGTVLVLGHPYVDVWQAVKPARVGLDAWPVIERGTEWKRGILRELGWPAASQADVARAWQRILGTVRTYADLEPSLLGRVEELIDFVTAPQG